MIDTLVAIGEETGKSVAQVALNWVLNRPGITAPIIGARNMQQLEDNLGAAGWSLDQTHMDRLTDVSETDVPYPYSVIRSQAQRR